MKKLLVLAGGSKRNEAWGEACVEAFKNDFDEVHFVRYDHWKTGEKNIDFDVEMSKISAVVEATEKEGEWYIFAKSIGTILSLKSVQAEIITPKKCVFFGMPLNLVADSVFADDWSLLETFTIPSLEFHNDNDPTANYEFTIEKFEAFGKTIQTETLSGDNHDYLDFTDYKSKINAFLLS